VRRRELVATMAALVAIVAIVAFIAAIVPVAMEREDRRVCIQAEGWVQRNGATEIPAYCYEKGYLERK
jgi:hypothetical protein